MKFATGCQGVRALRRHVRPNPDLLVRARRSFDAGWRLGPRRKINVFMHLPEVSEGKRSGQVMISKA